MNGWLIYTPQGARRNEWFIQRLIEESAKRNMALRLVLAENPCDLPKDETPDFAVCRAMNYAINAELENRGVRTFNNAKTAKIAGDKWETYLLCKRLNIPVLPTVLAEKRGNDKYPQVVKSRFGHGGSEVFWAETQTQAQDRIDKKDTYILQQPCETLGEDTRVYAVGGRIVAAVKRTSVNDFRSNFSLGGQVEWVQPTPQQIEIVDKLYQELSFDFIGIDFLPSQNGFVLNELEDAAGTRMLYACTDIDVVPIFVEHIAKK